MLLDRWMKWALCPFFVCAVFILRQTGCRVDLGKGVNARERQIETLISPTVEDLGVAVWGVELIASGKHSVLRVYIHKADGITVDDCAEVSREISDLLDVEEVFSGHFTLEVSSPGMDCILFKPEQYQTKVGERIEVRLHAPFEGRKRVVGLLAGLEENQVLVQVEDEEYVLPMENIHRTRVVPEFDGKRKAGKKPGNKPSRTPNK